MRFFPMTELPAHARVSLPSFFIIFFSFILYGSRAAGVSENVLDFDIPFVCSSIYLFDFSILVLYLRMIKQ